jgi:hypothetical protein
MLGLHQLYSCGLHAVLLQQLAVGLPLRLSYTHDGHNQMYATHVFCWSAAISHVLLYMRAVQTTKRTGWVRCNVQQPESIAGEQLSRSLPE